MHWMFPVQLSARRGWLLLLATIIGLLLNAALWFGAAFIVAYAAAKGWAAAS